MIDGVRLDNDRRSREQVTTRISTSPLDAVHLLFQDVYELPIITSRRQEMWLGIEIKALDWVERLGNEAKSHLAALGSSGSLPRAVCEAIVQSLSGLEADCSEISEVQPPKIEAWAAELLSVRQSVVELRRSRLRRFTRTLANIKDEPRREELINRAYDIAELLCLLPNSALRYLIEFGQTFERLPSLEEMMEWLETTSITSEQLLQSANQQAQMARDMLAAGYLRYVLRIARNYVEQGLDYLDLVQEGFIGLMKAAERFDYRQQARFGTYATSWIWQGIGRAIADQGRIIRLPVHLQDQVRKLGKAYIQAIDEGKDCPTLVDILLRMDILPEKDLKAVRKWQEESPSKPAPKRCAKALKRVRWLMECTQQTIPIDIVLPSTVGTSISMSACGCPPDEEVVFSEIIPDQNRKTLDTTIDLALAREKIHQALDELSCRERDVVALRFGLQDGQDRTLEEVGQALGVTRERIRQIEDKAIGKLKHPLRLLSGRAASPETLLPSIPLEVLDYLDEKFDYWQTQESWQNDLDWHWLDQLIDQLPGGDWHRKRFGDARTREDQLVAALRTISAPTHYVDIAEQLNDILETEELDEGYVYALLMRHEETFMLLGQGAFTMVAWEQNRACEATPQLPFCPSPLPDPPDQGDAFFESVLVARDILEHRPKAGQFLEEMFKWAGKSEVQPRWFQQSVLSAYYLVDLIPYAFCFDGSNPRLECTLPEMALQELRHHCLWTFTQRLVGMAEFWWLFQRYQPTRPSTLGTQFAESHPSGLDDALNRLSILTSLGASQRLAYGRYRLTALGERLADQWKQCPAFTSDTETDQDSYAERELELVDLGIW